MACVLALRSTGREDAAGRKGTSAAAMGARPEAEDHNRGKKGRLTDGFLGPLPHSTQKSSALGLPNM